MSCIERSGWISRSITEPSGISKSIRPLVTFAREPSSTRRMIDRAVTDLPDPDSPTTPSVSPGWISKPTESMAVNSSNVTVRSVTERRATATDPGASG